MGRNIHKMRYIRSIAARTLRVCAFVAFTLLTFSNHQAFAQDAARGEKLFVKCASCHNPKLEKKSTGPALYGALERQPDEELMRRWIRNSQKVLAEGNDYYSALYAEYNETVMTAFPALTDEDLTDLIEYIRTYEPAAEPIVGAGDATAGGGEEAESNYIPWIIILIVIFLVMIRVLGGVRKSLGALAAEKEGTEPEPELTMWQSTSQWIMGHKFQFTMVVLLFVFGGMVDGWYTLKGVGVYTDYAPEQPIKFSHQIHAGDHKIACEYCHHSAEKGKNAGIPSVNVCMNCHRSIQEGKRWGTEEISKIHTAAGYDPETNTYRKEPQPIEWVRIHNLPDFAYFNHSQHVIVGKQKCQTCHGKVEEFDYPMHQENDLTMGWCINCHRETDVSMEGNEYYDKLHEQLKEEHRKDPDWKAKVKDIGGLECAKCHY